MDASTMQCPGNCNGHGRCVDDLECRCDEGFKGPSCSTYCPRDCSAHGKCTIGIGCLCDNDFQGEDCAKVRCPFNCNDAGHCHNGICKCRHGYKG